MFKRIIGIILIVIGFLIQPVQKYIDSIYHTSIPYQALDSFLTWGFVLGGGYLFYMGLSRKETKAIKEFQKDYNDLKNNGEAIVVDLNECEIKEDTEGTTLVYTRLNNGEKEIFSVGHINRNKQDMSFKIYIHKTTMLYVDKNDRKHYHFDLSFLEHE